MKYDQCDPQAANLVRQLERAKEEIGTYQGLYAANMIEITKLKNRIGKLKVAQRKAHLPFNGYIE